VLDAFPRLPFSRFVPTPDLFGHGSDLRGQAHVAQVMVPALPASEPASRSRSVRVCHA
jgi:hypothetical protein